MVRVPLVVLELPSGGTREESPPYILTLWWYMERQIFSEVVLGVKKFMFVNVYLFSISV